MDAIDSFVLDIVDERHLTGVNEPCYNAGSVYENIYEIARLCSADRVYIGNDETSSCFYFRGTGVSDPDVITYCGKPKEVHTPLDGLIVVVEGDNSNSLHHYLGRRRNGAKLDRPQRLHNNRERVLVNNSGVSHFVFEFLSYVNS